VWWTFGASRTLLIREFWRDGRRAASKLVGVVLLRHKRGGFPFCFDFGVNPNGGHISVRAGKHATTLHIFLLHLQCLFLMFAAGRESSRSLVANCAGGPMIHPSFCARMVLACLSATAVGACNLVDETFLPPLSIYNGPRA
jgi:hypothetical protein